jgi:hypothetical protein
VVVTRVGSEGLEKNMTIFEGTSEIQRLIALAASGVRMP